MTAAAISFAAGLAVMLGLQHLAARMRRNDRRRRGVM